MALFNYFEVLTPPPRAPTVGLQGYLAHETPPPLGPYRRPVPGVLGGSWGVGHFLMGEVPLYGSVRNSLEIVPTDGRP